MTWLVIHFAQLSLCAFRHADVTALMAGEGEVIFHVRNNITSLTCAEVNYHLVTQKCK